MRLIAKLFRSRPDARKSTDHWRRTLTGRPDWMLENIVRNPGEFTLEMRTAASEILAQRRTCLAGTAKDCGIGSRHGQ
ncbi:MAG: hypothetical protein ACOZB0_09215 [Pseudomonadota bacterium]